MVVWIRSWFISLHLRLLLLKHFTQFRFFGLPGAGAFGKGGLAAGGVAFLTKQLTESVVRAGVFGREPDRVAERGFGAIEVALLFEGRAHHEPGFGIVRAK